VCELALFLALAATALTPAPALALPEGRVYEMVSPVYKAGYGVANIRAVAPDGESVVIESLGVFAGVLWTEEASLYLARRGESGWSTTSLTGPPITTTFDFSSTLEYALAQGSLEKSSAGGSIPSSGTQFLLHRMDLPNTAAGWELAADGLSGLGGNSEGESADLCHILLGRTGKALLPEAEGAVGTSGIGAEGQLYDLSAAPAGGCHGDGSQPLKLVAVKNKLGVHNEPEPIDKQCPAEPGLLNDFGEGQQQSNFNDISADGEEIFFTTCPVGGGGPGSWSAHLQLYVRVGGVKTLEVSEPVSEVGACGEVIPCPGAAIRAPAAFRGASESGSRVFFTTTARLVAGDEDEQSDLYMATIGCPEGEPGCEPAHKQVVSLVQVSHDPNPGEAAEVQGVVRVAPDGSRVYFVAHGVLSEGANVEGNAPVKGAENLYVYERDERYPAGHMAFVADLCSGPALSGGVEDKRCPRDLRATRGRNDAELWQGPRQEAQSTPDGGFLVFSTYGQLLKNDTDNAKDIYRYDAVTGLLDRVSLGEAGNDSNGNRNESASELENGKPGLADASIPAGGIDAGGDASTQHEMGTRAISQDGSRIVFTTAEPLSPDAVNGLADVYEWHKGTGEAGEGEVSMISSGSAVLPDREAVISPSGRDLFFVTSAALVPQDLDEATDVYDARLEGGFPPAPAERRPCSGDACPGPLTNPAPLLVPGSVSQAPGQNFAAPVSTTTVKPKAKSTAKCSKGKKLSHGKCVKTKAKKRKTKAKKAGNNRRTK
jgi:hypothetical protein